MSVHIKQDRNCEEILLLADFSVVMWPLVLSDFVAWPRKTLAYLKAITMAQSFSGLSRVWNIKDYNCDNSYTMSVLSFLMFQVQWWIIWVLWVRYQYAVSTCIASSQRTGCHLKKRLLKTTLVVGPKDHSRNRTLTRRTVMFEPLAYNGRALRKSN